MMEVLNAAAIMVAGLMIGCELAIAAFIHPTLDKLPDDAHQPAASAIARVLGRFMAFWYIVVSLLNLAEVVVQWGQCSHLRTFPQGQRHLQIQGEITWLK